MSNSIASTFNRSGAIRAVANLSLTEFQVRFLALFLLFSLTDGFEWFWMGSPHKNIQLMLSEFLKARYLVLRFLLYINDLPDDVVCNIAIYDDGTTLYSKCDQPSDMWQLLELVSELESHLRVTVDRGRKWLVDFNAGKTQLVSFDRSDNMGAIDVKMDGSFLEEKTYFKMLWLFFSSKLD